jgi:hypothetical protein
MHAERFTHFYSPSEAGPRAFQRLYIACATYDTAASLPVSSSVEQLLRKYKAVLLENMLSISTGYDSHEHWQAAK